MTKGPEPAADESNRLSAAASLPEASPRERRSIEESSRPSAALIHETIRAEGESELDRPASALLLSGLAAGLSMGLSLIGQGLLQTLLPDAGWRPVLADFGYCFGFLVVVLGRQQLFTENTLTPVLPLLYHRDGRTLLRLVRLWILVLAANIAGTWLVAQFLVHTSAVGPEIKATFLEISRETIAGPFTTTMTKGIVAGWVIALMVWLLPGAAGARLFVIILLTWLVGLGDFAHIIAGSVDAAYLVASGEAGWRDYAIRFFAPTLLGNVIGGVVLVAVLNYGQVAREVGPRA